MTLLDPWLFWTACACERKQGAQISVELEQSSSKHRKESMLIFTRLPWDEKGFALRRDFLACL